MVCALTQNISTQLSGLPLFCVNKNGSYTNLLLLLILLVADFFGHYL